MKCSTFFFKITPPYQSYCRVKAILYRNLACSIPQWIGVPTSVFCVSIPWSPFYPFYTIFYPSNIYFLFFIHTVFFFFFIHTIFIFYFLSIQYFFFFVIATTTECFDCTTTSKYLLILLKTKQLIFKQKQKLFLTCFKITGIQGIVIEQLSFKFRSFPSLSKNKKSWAHVLPDCCWQWINYRHNCPLFSTLRKGGTY